MQLFIHAVITTRHSTGINKTMSVKGISGGFSRYVVVIEPTEQFVMYEMFKFYDYLIQYENAK